MQIGLAMENICLHHIIQRTERVNSVGQMAINLSHGIKNILQAVGGAAEVVDYSLEHNMPDKAMSGWKILKCNLAKIRKLVLDMLEFSKDSKLILSSCDFNKLVESAVESLRTQAEEKKVSLTMRTDAKIPSVYLDGDKIQDVTMNLVLNAIEAVSPQTGAVTVETNYTDAEEPAITLTVKDNGPGIKAEDKETIFQPFQSSKAKIGTGLGLPIVRKMVYQHGGKVEVDNNIGGGAVFKVTLPAKTQKPV